MSIKQSIVSRLTDKEKAPLVARLIENTNGTFRIYPGEIDEGQPAPNIAYECNDGDPVAYAGGVLGLTRSVMVLNCWGVRQEDAEKLRNEIRLNISGLSGHNIGPHAIRRILVKDGGDIRYTNPENKPLSRRGVQLELDIWYVEQAPSPT